MISVRPFEDKDAQPLSGLLIEMAGFYGAAIDPKLVVADDVARQARVVDIIVAHEGDGLLGFATFAPLYPVAGLIPFIYVQQLYVSVQARRLGVGQRLMAAIAHIAKARGVTSIEWSTGQGNTAARALYEGFGAVGSEKMSYVLNGLALDQLAAKAE